MKRFLLIALYVFLFTLASLLICRLPSLIEGEIFFGDHKEILLCIIAGVASGLIVGFFSTGEKQDQK